MTPTYKLYNEYYHNFQTSTRYTNNLSDSKHTFSDLISLKDRVIDDINNKKCDIDTKIVLIKDFLAVYSNLSAYSTSIPVITSKI
tara:strand:+ start:635 stop:889 length:255 start_codon:yes stop_codon:yes gene_type:complete